MCCQKVNKVTKLKVMLKKGVKHVDDRVVSSGDGAMKTFRTRFF